MLIARSYVYLPILLTLPGFWGGEKKVPLKMEKTVSAKTRFSESGQSAGTSSPVHI
jgi:hypothetical protein